MIYLDTSVLGSIFFREPGAVALVGRVAELERHGLAISAWTLTEMASVAGIKERTGAIGSPARQRAMAEFQRFVSSKLETVEIDPADFRVAAAMIDGPVPLRSGDALHLAVIRRIGATLVTLDQQLGVAADAQSIPRIG